MRTAIRLVTRFEDSALVRRASIPIAAMGKGASDIV